MRDPSRRFQRKDERLRRPSGPAREQRFSRDAVERVIDLDGVEPLGIIRKHLAGRELLRIKRSSPLGIVVTGRSDKVVHSLILFGLSLSPVAIRPSPISAFGIWHSAFS